MSPECLDQKQEMTQSGIINTDRHVHTSLYRDLSAVCALGDRMEDDYV